MRPGVRGGKKDAQNCVSGGFGVQLFWTNDWRVLRHKQADSVTPEWPKQES